MLTYIDTTNEKASLAILRQLGVQLDTSQTNASKAKSLDETVAKIEHKCHHPIKYYVVAGTAHVEFRDWADCWVRATLSAGDRITLPPSLYRRILSEKHTTVTYDAVDADVYSLIYRFTEVNDSVSVPTYHNYRELVCELCRQFFQAGWVTGTGGSISIRHGNRIYMTPSGVQKERIQPDELYVLDIDGEVLSVPYQKPGGKAPKLSDCSPLFLHAFQQRNAGAVLHSHSFCTNIATSLFEGQSEFRISHQEMIKGITGYGYFDELVIPIIENTAWEHELADSLGETIAKYPKACAVLVRRHGMYVWGDSWEQAKRHGECLHYLFEIAINYRKLGMDFNSPPKPLVESESSIMHVVFDIEGTTTPITYVKDVLFPYASNNVKSYLQQTWDTELTKNSIKSLIEEKHADYTSEISSSIDSIVSYVQWCISKDLKIGSLKQVQGHIWDQGYKSGELRSKVYDDVPAYFDRLCKAGIKISIYSSGSRDAQKLLFKYSNHGDLRRYISCYFDTKIGNKRDSSSYKEIIQSLGVDAASQIMFITDVTEEADAAVLAGMQSVVSVRPGNADISDHVQHRKVFTFNEL